MIQLVKCLPFKHGNPSGFPALGTEAHIRNPSARRWDEWRHRDLWAKPVSLVKWWTLVLARHHFKKQGWKKSTLGHSLAGLNSHTDTQRDIDTHTQTNIYTERQTYTDIDTHIYRETDRHTYIQTDITPIPYHTTNVPHTQTPTQHTIHTPPAPHTASANWKLWDLSGFSKNLKCINSGLNWCSFRN